MADEQDVKPKVEGGGPPPLNIIVKDQNGGEVHFKIKGTTKLGKVMDAYCAKKALNESTVKFVFDGQRLNKAATPEELGMEDGDAIDAMIEQLGGQRL